MFLGRCRSLVIKGPICRGRFLKTENWGRSLETWSKKTSLKHWNPNTIGIVDMFWTNDVILGKNLFWICANSKFFLLTVHLNTISGMKWHYASHYYLIVKFVQFYKRTKINDISVNYFLLLIHDLVEKDDKFTRIRKKFFNSLTYELWAKVVDFIRVASNNAFAGENWHIYRKPFYSRITFIFNRQKRREFVIKANLPAR